MADKSIAVLFTQAELLVLEEALSSLDREVDRPGDSFGRTDYLRPEIFRIGWVLELPLRTFPGSVAPRR